MSDEFQSETVLDVGVQQVGAVYGRALIGAAQEAGRADEVVADLEALMDEVVTPRPEFRQVLESALVPHEEKEKILDRCFGGRISPLLMAFLKVLSARGRIDCLAGVRQTVRQLYNELRGQVAVSVRTAAPLDATVRDEMSAALEKSLGRRPRLHEEVDRSLLGGIVVKVGDVVYDGSVVTQLRQLRGRIVDKSVEKIQTSRESFV